MKIFMFLKTNDRVKFLCIGTTNGFALNHGKCLKISFICVKHQANDDFLKKCQRHFSFNQISCMTRPFTRLAQYCIDILPDPVA